MDHALITAAAALARGQPLLALPHVALRDDGEALALRGIAMAQLGDLARARALLREAGARLGPAQALARARCRVAEAEVALALREADWPARALAAAVRTLERHGDRANALHARLVEARRAVLFGELERAAHALSQLSLAGAPPLLLACAELVRAELALRQRQARAARGALARAKVAAQRAGIAALTHEIEQAEQTLRAPAARLSRAGQVRLVDAAEVELVLRSPRLIVDACARAVMRGSRRVELASRPVLFALARALGEAFPGEVPRETLIARAFDAQRPNASHRARLRVELGRLRKQLAGLAALRATERGFVLAPVDAAQVVVLAPPLDSLDSALVALLADGAAWSTSALALAAGNSQRQVQRVLAELMQRAHVRSIGQGRAQRWLARPLSGIATSLLLPAPPAARYAQLELIDGTRKS